MVRLNVPNVLTVVRILLVPVLVLRCWGRPSRRCAGN
jgi:phosphatidylglycerophosphate synthase